MGRSHLTLAALATSAVEGMNVVSAAPFGAPGGDFDSALLTGDEGQHWLIRVPRSERAEAEQSADIVALRALSTGVRTRLPFAVSQYVGQAPIDGTRAVVFEFVYGDKASVGAYTPGPEGLAASVGRSIAAIHSLPTGFVTDAGMPVLGASECLRTVLDLLDRATATGIVPPVLTSRWEKATDDSNLWQFQPTVINGALGSGSFLSEQGVVTGVLGWQSLKVGDPATDLQWIIATRDENIIDSALGAYTTVRGEGDRQLRQRATFYSELDVVKWLLHGTETRNTEIVDDAAQMLTNLVDDLRADLMNPLGAEANPTIAIDDLDEYLNNQRAV